MHVGPRMLAPSTLDGSGAMSGVGSSFLLGRFFLLHKKHVFFGYAATKSFSFVCALAP